MQAFKDAVRDRDGGCVVSKVPNLCAEEDLWEGFEATHIFPLAYGSQWEMDDFGRCITIDPPQGGKINSVQNGLLLRANLHQEWDHYRFSINPWVSFLPLLYTLHLLNLLNTFRMDTRSSTSNADANGVAGTALDNQLLLDPRRPVDELLRWHFRQAVLANIRGAGEPPLEHDFPPGSDMIGEIMAGPKAAERMEFEIFDRLARHVDIVKGER